jgi:uncharacterized delta-60 repeat protein
MHRHQFRALMLASTLAALVALPLAAQPSDLIRFTSSGITVLEPSGEALIPLVRSGSGTTAYARLDLTPGSATAADYVAAPGRLDPAFPDAQINAIVRALAVQADGKILIGGAFTALGDTSHERIARLNADGSLDPTFTASADGPVTAIAVQPDGAIIIGGFFSNVNAQPRTRLARLNTNGSLDPDFDPGLSPGNPGFPNGVLALAVQSDGAILVGGEFSSIAGSAWANLARLTPAGDRDPTFNPIVNGPVYAILQFDDQAARRIRIGGNFTLVNGESRRSLAALANDGGFDSTFNPFVNPNGIVYGLARSTDGKLLVGGFFTEVFVPFSDPPIFRPGLVRLGPDGNLDRTFNLGGTTDGVITRVAVQPDGNVLIAGQFTNTNLPDRANLARLNPDGSLDPAFASGLGPDGPVEDLILLENGAVLIGGLFNRYDLEPAPTMIARIQGDLFARWDASDPVETLKTVRLPILIDDLDEGTEEMTITLTPFGAAAGEPATFTLRIRDRNSVPTALPLSVTGSEPGDLPITLVGDDADDDPLTFTVGRLPARGRLYQYAAGERGAPIIAPNTPLSDPDGRVIFAPEPNTQGVPYSSFTYRVSDAFSASAPAIVVVNIAPVFRMYLPVAR